MLQKTPLPSAGDTSSTHSNSEAHALLLSTNIFNSFADVVYRLVPKRRHSASPEETSHGVSLSHISYLKQIQQTSTKVEEK